MDFSDPNDIRPVFFKAELQDGKLDLTDVIGEVRYGFTSTVSLL